MSPFLAYLKSSVQRARRQGLLLTSDLTEEQMCVRPSGLLHPAWLLGHLNLYYEDVLVMLHDQPFVDDSKDHPLFAPGTQPLEDPALYPTKAELLNAFKDGHDQILAALDQTSPVLLDRKTNATSLPTVGAFLIHLMIDHEWHHLGQLAAWRRAMNLPFPDEL